MTMLRRQSYISPEQFLEIQRNADRPSEYMDGEMIAMAGASKAHGLIVVTASHLFYAGLEGKSCVASSGISVVAPSSYLIPDVVVYCGDGDFAPGDDILRNPIAIVEVLSDSTDGYDHGAKWMRYQQIPSLKYYIMISQHQPTVEIFSRESADRWNYHVVSGQDSTFELPDFDLSISLADLYRLIEFPNETIA